MSVQPLFGCADEQGGTFLDSLFSEDIFLPLGWEDDAGEDDAGAESSGKYDFPSFDDWDDPSPKDAETPSIPVPASIPAVKALEPLPNKRRRTSNKSLSPEEQLRRSRERNKIHAKRSRIRKKLIAQGLQAEAKQLREQNAALLAALRANVPGWLPMRRGLQP